MAASIYNLTENNKPTPEYYRQSQIMAKSQVALAGYELATKLNNFL